MKEKYALNLTEDGRILSATFEKYALDSSVLVDDLPEGNLADYCWQDEAFVYNPLPTISPTTEDQIASLKAQLSSTDYKIIKCSEAQLLGEELPYDITSLHAERQALRDKINELEAELESENNQEGGAI